MFPAAFGPWLDERVLECSNELLVVDKPSGLPVHGGDSALADDVVTRLAAWLERAALDARLGVHQRLDLGTSGVLLFSRDRELGARLQADFENGRVEKRYVAVAELAPDSPLRTRDQLSLRHQLAVDGKLRRVVREGGKVCRAECRVLARQGRRVLLELKPETGRTHQLRVQLAAVGAPIAGDRDYGGVAAPRLMLHAERLESPALGRAFSAPTPAIFRRFLAGDEASLGEADELRRKLRDAACRRYPLLAVTNAFRWVNAVGDELPGIEIDWYAGYATLSLASEAALERREELLDSLLSAGALGVYVKERARSDLRHVDHAALAPAEPSRGVSAEALVVHEHGMSIAVELGDGLSTGLFLDQRDNRRRVRELSRGARVLNLFCYTASFSLAAALGGAARVTSVDVSRRALRRGQQNFEKNGLDPRQHAFIDEDAVRYLERARARGERFELVVLDPPSFSSAGKGKALSIERDYQKLAQSAVAVLSPGGRLLAVTNHRRISRAALRRMVLSAAESAGHTADVKALPSGLDCPEGPNGPIPSKSVLLTLRP
jgi:23S rRNA (cytosine1962-C5)-methyltransferase